MRRLLLLSTILLLAWAALRHAAALDPLPGYVLRDSLLLLLALAAASAWAARPWLPPRSSERAWPNAGRALFGAGAITALAGGLLPNVAPAVAAYATTVWMVGLALAGVGLPLRGAVVRYAPPAVRWERDDAGRIVGKPLSAAAGANTLGRRGWLALSLLLIAAIALRVWLVQRAPAWCVGSECDLLAATSAGAARTTLLLQPLAAWLAGWTGNPLQGLRLVSALVSSLALLSLIPALHRLTSPGGVLLGVALAGFGTWAATPRPEAALFAPLVVWAAAAIGDGGARAWAMAGLALGLTAAAAPAPLGAWLLWLVALLVVALTLPQRGRLWVAALLLLAALAGGSLLVVQSAPLPGLPSDWPAWPDLTARAGALYATLFTQGALGLGALAVVGVGAALRQGRRGALLLSGAGALLGWLLLLPDGLPQWPLLLPFLLLLAALAADQLLRAALLGSRPLLRPRPVTAAALALVLVAMLPGLWRTLDAPQTQDSGASADMAQAMAAYITAARVQAESESGAPLLLVPAPLLDAPTLRLAVAPDIQAERVQGYTLQSDLPFAGDAPDGLVYLLAVDDTAAREELWRVYPTGVAAPANIDPSLPALTTFSVSRDDLAASNGLIQLIAATSSGNAANNADLSTSAGPLDFGWAAYPPAPPPFAAEWRGSLIVRERGDYTFSVESSPGALFTLLLDNRLILDSSAGLTSYGDALPAGAYAITMRYQSSSAPGNLRVLWQPPGLEPAPIPLEALHNPAIPTVGLVGTYTSGALWDGPILAERKDRVIQADSTLPAPWSVHWTGQLATPRAGEYLIGAVSDGAMLIEVDGQAVVTQLGGEQSEGGYAPAEGTIYLEAGWTSITVRYATGNQPGDVPEIKLYWQPPGSGPAPLNVAYLHPSQTPLAPSDAPLPALPSVLDARLGDDSFALSGESAYWLPQTRIPARTLPALNLERVRDFGSCGPAVSQLDAPHGLAWDAARETLYVADTGNRRVLALRVDGEGVFQPEVVPMPELEEPVDVAVSPDGILYVLDTAAPRLIEFEPAGGAAITLALGEGFYRPRGLDVDAAGLLYIADTGGARVAVVKPSADGAPVVVQGQFGGQGTPLGSGQPVDVTVAPQAIWAIAAEEGRLWRMDGLGSLTAIRPTDTINGPHLAHLADGRLVLSDPARGLVLLLSAQGQPMAALGDAGIFQRPTGVAAWQRDGELLLAVSDTAACSVSLWRGAAP